jgi:transcriptional regulator with GAF, ATPase, and Fis domain
MNVDPNEFFRQAAGRICGSLDIQRAMASCFHYIKEFLPLTHMSLHLLDPGLNVVRLIASFTAEGGEGFGRILPLPEEGRNERASRWASMEEIRIINRPDSELHIRKLFQALGRSLDVSLMVMRLELEGSRVGSLSLMASGTEQYTDEHAKLLLLLREPFAIAMANALEHQEVLRLKDILVDDNRYLQRQLLSFSGSEIIGADFGLKRVMNMVRQVATLDSPVLLLGETGTGKEVIATAIHYSSPRREGPFIKVNCGAIPESLMDSELFGHEKGAFTGAITQKRGRFERADRGTIFLDEIGELPPQAQVRLLHVLQNREIERVGGTESIPVDIRILFASNRDLEAMVNSGRFREDLWFRLNVFPIRIPPLRQRKEDIPALVHHFIEKKSVELKLGVRPKLGPGALDQLRDYDWPGNVRELQNVVERALIQHGGGTLAFAELSLPRQQAHEMVGAEEQDRAILPLDEINSRYIRRVLELSNGKINGPGGAAELLAVHPNTLRKKMEKLGIPYKRKKSA